MSEDFGSYLKHERELRGIPLDEIAQTTKISLRFLRALEENRFEELPGEVFVKGFIRSYGQAIGSNVDELLAAYHESGSHQKAKATVTLAADPSKAAQPKRASEFPTKAVLGFAAALLVVLAGGYWITAKKEGPASPPQQSPVTSVPTVDNQLPGIEGDPGTFEEAGELEDPQPEPSPAPTENRQVPAPSQSTPAPAAKTPPESSAIKNTVTVPENSGIIKDLQDQSVPETIPSTGEPALGDASLQLVIRVSENSWFNLRIDEHRDQDFILPPGGTKTIQASNGIVITIGNRRATQLLLNGQPLELPESPDNVIRNLTVNAEQLN